MCDANDPLASTPPPIWPPPKGGVSIDEIWDDGPLLQNYKNMEEHVKKQVERFKNSVRPPPATSMPSKSTPPTPPVPQSLPTQPSAATPGRKKRRNNKHKRGGGAAAATAAAQQQQTPVVPVHPAAIVSPAPAPISNPAPPSSPSPPSNGVDQHSSPQHPSSPSHPPCSSFSRGPEGLHASSSDNKAVSNPENASANTPSAASPTTYATAPSSPARAASSSSPISTGPSVVPAIPDAALAPAPVVPAPAPAAIPAPMYPLISHLPVDLMPPPHPPVLCPSPSGSSSARFGSPQQPSCLLPTPVEAQTTSSLTASLTTPNGEFNMSLLLRAWYEAGYAMGQAHADQILGLRPGLCGSGDGSDEDEDDDDDEEEVEQQVVQQKKGKPRKTKK